MGGRVRGGAGVPSEITTDEVMTPSSVADASTQATAEPTGDSALDTTTQPAGDRAPVEEPTTETATDTATDAGTSTSRRVRRRLARLGGSVRPATGPSELGPLFRTLRDTHPKADLRIV